MKKYYVNDTDLASVRHHDRCIAVYLASDVDASVAAFNGVIEIKDARIAELERECNDWTPLAAQNGAKADKLRAALSEAMGWNWLTEPPNEGIPTEVVAQCEAALSL